MKQSSFLAITAAFVIGATSLAYAQGAMGNEPMGGMATGGMSMKMNPSTHLKSLGGPLAHTLRDHPVVVMIDADWCPACKQVKPVLNPLLMSYGDKVHVVILDVTDGKTAAGAKSTAKKLGLSAFFKSAKSLTSTVAVINPKTGEIVGEFYDDTDKNDYVSAIDKTATALENT